jgi:chemotaxis protein MotA
MNAYQLENLMDNEIETCQEDGDIPVQAIHKLADGMPAFGIVAAVMGVVHTMGAIGRPPAELGSLIAAALVGTFLGILLSYGLVAPLASLMHRRHQEVVKALQCVHERLRADHRGGVRAQGHLGHRAADLCRAGRSCTATEVALRPHVT